MSSHSSGVTNEQCEHKKMCDWEMQMQNQQQSFTADSHNGMYLRNQRVEDDNWSMDAPHTSCHLTFYHLSYTYVSISDYSGMYCCMTNCVPIVSSRFMGQLSLFFPTFLRRTEGSGMCNWWLGTFFFLKIIMKLYIDIVACFVVL